MIWHLLANPDTCFHDLGADYFSRRINPNTQKRAHIRQLKALGYNRQQPPAPGEPARTTGYRPML